MTELRPMLELTASKRYGGRPVLDDARLVVRAGTVHGLVGENGAGKSTLVKIAAGLVRADRGELWLGSAVPLGKHGVALAERRGVGLVQQHGVLVPTLTVVENAVLGREPTRGGLLALREVAARLGALGVEHGLSVDPWARAGDLSVGQQQRAEIVIALHRGATLLMLDEPTAVLAPVEVAGLLAVLRTLADAGGAVVLVTHKLDEIVEVADDVTVLRAGKVAARFSRGDGGDRDGAALSAEAIARAMVGGEPPPRVGPPRLHAGAAAALSVRGLVVDGGGRQHGPAIAGVSLEVGSGEVVGVAGVEGNGQRELVLALTGLAPARAGAITLGGHELAAASVRTRQLAGLGHIPEDRHDTGLWLDGTVEDNLALGRHRELSGALIDRGAWRAHAERLVAEFDVRPADITAPVWTLSGGNQQKLVVARELTRPALKLLLAVQPTRGVDLGAQALIHDRLRAAAARGVGVLCVSADLDELLALCHRIVVLHRGRLAGGLAGEALRAADARARLGAWMTGAAQGAAA